MTKRQFYVCLTLVSVFSFLGGIIGGMFTGGSNLYAQKSADKSGLQMDRLNAKQISTEILSVSKMILLNPGGAGKGSVSMAVNEEGIPTINVMSKGRGAYNKSGSVIQLGLNQNGDPIFKLTDENFSKRIEIGFLNGSPHLTISHSKQPRMVIDTNVTALDQQGNSLGKLY